MSESPVVELSVGAHELFMSLFNNRGNWAGMPLIGESRPLTKQEEGWLLDLKKKNLLKTHRDEGCVFAVFTPEGVEYGNYLRTIMGLEVEEL